MGFNLLSFLTVNLLSYFTFFLRGAYFTWWKSIPNKPKSVCFLSEVLGPACARGLILGLPSQIGNPAQNLDVVVVSFACNWVAIVCIFFKI